MKFQDDSRDDFFLSVAADHSAADVGSVYHFGNVSEFQRHPVDFADRDAADIVQRFEHTDSAHEIFLRADFNILPADIPVVPVDCVCHVIE